MDRQRALIIAVVAGARKYRRLHEGSDLLYLYRHTGKYVEALVLEGSQQSAKISKWYVVPQHTWDTARSLRDLMPLWQLHVIIVVGVEALGLELLTPKSTPKSTPESGLASELELGII